MNNKKIIIIAIFILIIAYLSIPRYVIFKDQQFGFIIKYNKLTGKTWRYFRNVDTNNNPIKEGWIELKISY